MKGGEIVISRLFGYLAGLPHHRSLLIVPTYTLLKSIDVVECGLHPSLERPGECGCGGAYKKKKEFNTHIVRELLTS